ncbi:hypothetical protein M4D79_14150 [Mycolicibacterium novocastrense]|nr:hypothetical protein M4D79_14150 [Mycolicibacterium novocastrense]
MTDTITVRIAEINAEPMLDSQCMSLLFGVPVSDVKALPFVNGHSRIPREWIKRGQRRAGEAKAHTGSDALLDSLRYWARKDHDARLEVVYE